MLLLSAVCRISAMSSETVIEQVAILTFYDFVLQMSTNTKLNTHIERLE